MALAALPMLPGWEVPINTTRTFSNILLLDINFKNADSTTATNVKNDFYFFTITTSVVIIRRRKFIQRSLTSSGESDMHPMLNIAVRAARNAGNVIAKAYEQLEKVEVQQKGSNDFVTNVDKEAELAIINTIRKSYPEHSIVAEESGELAGSDNDYQWIIDPLDGTTNFVRGVPHFAVSIALRVKGKTEQAVVYDPINNELFSATRGAGAQLNGYRIRSTQPKELKGTLLATGFPFKQKHHSEAYFNIFADLFTDVADMRRAGSAALDLAYVAAGRFDGFWELGLKPWDFAAGELIAKEAGAIVTDFAGNHDYLKSGNLVVGGPKVVKQLLSKIRPHLTESMSR